MIPISSLLNQQENRVYPDYTIVLDGSQIESQSPFLTSTTTVEVARLNDAEKQQVKCFRRNWTPDHDQFIKDNLPHNTYSQCVELFEKKDDTTVLDGSLIESRSPVLTSATTEAVPRQKEAENQQVKSRFRTWTKERDQFIKENYPNKSHIECAKLFEERFLEDLPITTLRDRAAFLGLTFKPKEVAEKVQKSRVINWTPDHDQFIRENYPRTERVKCAKLFEERYKIRMPVSTLRGRASVLGIALNKGGVNWNWTHEMDMFLLNKCEMCTYKEAEELFFEEFGSRRPSRTLKYRCAKLKKLSKSVE